MKRRLPTTSPIKIKEFNEGSGEFMGYAAGFNNRDHGDDIIIPGAFVDFIKSKQPRDVKVLWQHDWGAPIGVNASMKEDDYGLLVEGKLVLDVQKAREALALKKADAIDGMSIGYVVEQDAYDATNKVRLLQKLHLMEYSWVTFPMNENARVLSAKSLDTLTSLSDCETYLRDVCGFSRNEAKLFISRVKSGISVEADELLQADGLKRLAESLENLNKDIRKGV